MNRLLQHPLFFTGLDHLIGRALAATPLVSPDHAPRERIRETETTHQIEIDLPGLRREELKLELKNRQLRLTVTPTEERPFVASETRLWNLGNSVDAQALQARFENGVLRIELPKLAPATLEPTTIDIQ